MVNFKLDLIVCLFCFVSHVHAVSIQDVLSRESAFDQPFDHKKLAELHAFSGENSLLAGEYEKALENFENARMYLEENDKETLGLSVRVHIGEVVSYDNLGLQLQAEEVLNELRAIVDQMECGLSDEENFSRMVVLCKSKKKETQPEKAPSIKGEYDDLFAGPDWEPWHGYCVDAVRGEAKILRKIAKRAGAGIHNELERFISNLEENAERCSWSHSPWKGCVGPIARKRQAWEKSEKTVGSPQEGNLHFYIK